ADLPEVARSRVEPVGGTETILLVEDQPEVRAVIRNALARYGYVVLDAAGGPEALAMLEKFDGEVHLLLTDVVMPGMSGRALADWLLVSRPSLRVLYTSGYTDDTIVHHGVLEAGIAFIQKPFTPSVLLKRVRDILDAP
ncbi:MAG TPA: response regulator, partial [Vicinamibacterales bacterium]